ncbi:hypothetical protein BGZ96_010405 [Linnemannia gamsii]|uniref:Uncharacterized protein n=1 Tax=Linnemannia gamsii TaxID=64522 RepID=A0ABQ7KEU3_9FUNG|nr:hypothetical protein BGZ96_010405 [Linnemannia gamsii]
MRVDNLFQVVHKEVVEKKHDLEYLSVDIVNLTQVEDKPISVQQIKHDRLSTAAAKRTDYQQCGTVPKQEHILMEDEIAGGDINVDMEDKEEEEDTVKAHRETQKPRLFKFVAKDHRPEPEVKVLKDTKDDADDGDDDAFNMAVATTVFGDEYLDLLFNRIARLYEQLPIMVVQDMLPSIFNIPTPSTSSSSSASSCSPTSLSFSSNIHNGNPPSSTATATAAFFLASKTVAQLWKKWFTSELNRTSIWMLEVYFKDWKRRGLVTERQMEVFKVEKGVVRSVLERVRNAERVDETFLMQGRGNGNGVGARRGSGGRRRSSSNGRGGVGGGNTLKERVKTARDAVEADVMREGSMRRYYDGLGLSDNITWVIQRRGVSQSQL